MTRWQAESDYWDKIAKQCWPENRVADNGYKRQPCLGRLLLACEWIDQDVLEIGHGVGTVAAAINISILGRWRYRGTDVSALFVAKMSEQFGLDCVVAQVTKLPGEDGQFSRVICLDTLEHVHPQDREQGYAEIARVTAPAGLLLINMPLSEDAFHDPQFDHPFGFDDLHRIERAGFRTRSFERWTPRGSMPGTTPRPSGFVVMERS